MKRGGGRLWSCTSWYFMSLSRASRRRCPTVNALACSDVSVGRMDPCTVAKRDRLHLLPRRAQWAVGHPLCLHHKYLVHNGIMNNGIMINGTMNSGTMNNGIMHKEACGRERCCTSSPRQHCVLQVNGGAAPLRGCSCGGAADQWR